MNKQLKKNLMHKQLTIKECRKNSHSRSVMNKQLTNELNA